MQKAGDILLLLLGAVLILAGSAGLAGVPLFGIRAELLPAILLIVLGLAMILAQRARRVSLSLRDGKIEIERDIPAKEASKGFDEVDEQSNRR